MGTFFASRNLLEAHLFDVELDLYGQEITVYPLHKIRNNQKFENLEVLIDAIKKDEKTIRELQRTVMTFGTFDHFHPGHESYLNQAKAFGDKLVTVIALDDTVARIKDNAPDNSEQQRLTALQDLGLTNHHVQLGDPENVYSCLEQHEPEVIYLGYDQDSFDKGLETYYT